jgi:hypothetical protein
MSSTSLCAPTFQTPFLQISFLYEFHLPLGTYILLTLLIISLMAKLPWPHPLYHVNLSTHGLTAGYLNSSLTFGKNPSSTLSLLYFKPSFLTNLPFLYLRTLFSFTSLCLSFFINPLLQNSPTLNRLAGGGSPHGTIYCGGSPLMEYIALGFTNVPFHGRCTNSTIYLHCTLMSCYTALPL